MTPSFPTRASSVLVAEIAFAEYTASGSVRHASFVGLRADKEARNVTPEIREAAPAPTTDVVISNRSRVLFPETKATKGDLTDYYAAVAPIILPYMARRPVSLVRCPQGRAKQCFLQTHDTGSFGHLSHPVPLPATDRGWGSFLH